MATVAELKERFVAYFKYCEGPACFYCGQPAATIDHVPPRSVRRLMRSDPKAFGKYSFHEVDCCTECNCLLGKKFWTLVERKAYIAKTLPRRYAYFLKFPDWSDEEIKGHPFERDIKLSLEIRRITKLRMKWAGSKTRIPRISNNELDSCYKKVDLIPLVCDVCGKPFKGYRSNKRCSGTCIRVAGLINAWAGQPGRRGMYPTFEKRRSAYLARMGQNTGSQPCRATISEKTTQKSYVSSIHPETPKIPTFYAEVFLPRHFCEHINSTRTRCSDPTETMIDGHYVCEKHKSNPCFI
jgi:hypothetical protein